MPKTDDERFADRLDVGFVLMDDDFDEDYSILDDLDNEDDEDETDETEAETGED